MNHPILDAINLTIEANQDTSHRNHLGASVIGDVCARKLWYGFRWATPIKHHARILRLFDRGKREEDVIVKHLESAFITVWQTDPQTKKQYRFVGYKGHFCGEIDGIGKGVLDEPYLLEFKTHNDKSFAALKSEGVALSKTNHYVQMQIYMGVFGLKQAVYIGVNKNDDDMYIETVEFEEQCFKNFSERAATIIDAPEPPPKISNNPSWYQCKFCDHHAVCHGEASPLKNCRTCAHSTPIENAEWHCEKDRTKAFPIIPVETIKTGCNDYIQHPMK